MHTYILVIGLLALKPRQSDQKDAEKELSEQWDYNENGPSTWSKLSPQCKGANQSPIDIVTSGDKLTKANYKNFINKTNYIEKPNIGQYQMVNNGHTLTIKLPANTTYEFKKGDNVFVPMEIDIHFDAVRRNGSEHMINGKKYFAELQIIHRNKKYTKNDIYNHPDLEVSGLLALAIFVDLKTDATKRKRTLYGYEEEYRNIMGVGTSLVMEMISTASQKIRKSGQKTNIDAFPLAWLFPSTERLGALYDYVNYHGSLTSPPCFEIVDWIVFTGKTLLTDEDAVKKMFKVRDKTGNLMSGSSRPAQELNGRKIYGITGHTVQHDWTSEFT